METSIKCIKYTLFLFNLLFTVSSENSSSHTSISISKNLEGSLLVSASPHDLFPCQLSGLFLIVTGGVVQGAYSQYLDFLGDQFFSTPVFLVIVGCVIFFVAFFGCCGAIKENHCMTFTFAILLGIIFLMEIGAGIAAYRLKHEVSVTV